MTEKEKAIEERIMLMKKILGKAKGKFFTDIDKKNIVC